MSMCIEGMGCRCLAFVGEREWVGGCRRCGSRRVALLLLVSLFLQMLLADYEE
jgi:hypothetical protein